MKKIRKLTVLIMAMLLFASVPVTAHAGVTANVTKIIKYLRAGKIYQADKIAQKLPKEYAPEKCISTMTKAQKKAYRKIIKRHVKYDADGYPSTGYYLTDIDNDGSAELIVHKGAYMFARYYFYTYKKEKVIKLGNFYNRLAVLSACPNRTGVLLMWVHEGVRNVVFLTIKNGKIHRESLATWTPNRSFTSLKHADVDLNYPWMEEYNVSVQGNKIVDWADLK